MDKADLVLQALERVLANELAIMSLLRRLADKNEWYHDVRSLHDDIQATTEFFKELEKRS